MSKPPHVERMENELSELMERLGKLDQFVAGGGFFDTLEEVDKSLLRAQAFAMQTYVCILSTRLDRA